MLVLKWNHWNDVDVIPRYMGYAKATERSIKNTGYPGCSDVESTYISSCTTGKMYGQNSCTMREVERSGAIGWTSCDTTPGHSGGPSFYTSGSSNYVIADESSRDENACAGTQCPSAVTGTNQWLFDFTGDLRSQYNNYTFN
ncbi:MAG: hypothetical protein MK135_08090 [Polyangiaceae bacterium]|nr:hypothetical protein [Polyangiaceae bacterium]